MTPKKKVRKPPPRAMTFEQIGRELGISWQKVQWLEKRAMRKLRAQLEAQGCRSLDDVYLGGIWRLGR